MIPWLKRLQVILSQWVTAYVALPYSWLASSVVVVALVVFAYHAGYANAREPAGLLQKAPDVIDSEYVQGLPEGDNFKPKITVPERVPGKEKLLREDFLVKLVNLEPPRTYPAVAVITSEPFLDDHKSFNASVRFKLPSTDKLGAQCAPFLVRNSREALEIQLLYPEISGPKEDQSLGFHVPESRERDFIIVLIWMSYEAYKYNHEDPKMLKIVVNQ